MGTASVCNFSRHKPPSPGEALREHCIRTCPAFPGKGVHRTGCHKTSGAIFFLKPISNIHQSS